LSGNNGSRTAKPNGKAVRKNSRGGWFRRAGEGGLDATALLPALRIIGGIALVAAMSVGFVAANDFLTQCDYFKAEVVAVEGCRRLDKETALRQARVFEGINTLSVNLRLARKRLLAHPWVAEAQVSRELPSGIHIRIREHDPLAILDMGRRFIINRDGAIFKEYAPSDTVDAPVVRGLEYMDIPLPKRAGSDPFQAVMTVLVMGDRTDSALPNRTIQEIRVDREMGLTLQLPETAPGPFTAIKLGYDDRAGGLGYDVKYKRFQEIIDFLAREGSLLRFDAIDLKNLDRIVINPAKGAASNGGTESLSEDQKEV
jgi:cell division protein FtsQ